MNIQFFAEEKESQTVNFDDVIDTADEPTTEENAEEETLGEETPITPQETKSKKQTRAEHYIQQRKNKKEEKNAYEEGRIKGLIEAYEGKNPFTGEEIKDKADQDELLTMLEMKSKGLDPIQDFAKYLKDKQRNNNQISTENESVVKNKKIDVAEDYINFQKNNPDVDLESLTNDSTFSDIYEDFSETVPLQKIYDLYQKISKNIEEKVNEKVINAKARMISSAGNLNENNGETPPLSYSKMSSKEFKEYKEKVKSGIINI